MKSGNLNSLEHSGSLQACNGTALPLPCVFDVPYSWVVHLGLRYESSRNFRKVCNTLHFKHYVVYEQDEVHNNRTKKTEMTHLCSRTARNTQGIILHYPNYLNYHISNQRRRRRTLDTEGTTQQFRYTQHGFWTWKSDHIFFPHSIH